MPLTQGQHFNERYWIAELIERGGFGAVYKAWDITLNRPVAIKESYEDTAEGQRQFLHEAQLLANLAHPNLPRVIDYFALAGQGQYLVMEFVDGQTLEELRVLNGGTLPEGRTLVWMAQVLEALSYIHGQEPPIIHRDIKPLNIKITPADKVYPQGRAMLVDFGVAKAYDAHKRTTVGARAVTPGFSPHEQYGQAGSNTDARTDIYALGATLYMLLTGQEPPESVSRLLRDPLIPPRQLNPSLSPEIEAVMLKAMSNDPELRFQTAEELQAVLADLLPTSAPSPAAKAPPPALQPAAPAQATPQQSPPAAAQPGKTAPLKSPQPAAAAAQPKPAGRPSGKKSPQPAGIAAGATPTGAPPPASSPPVIPPTFSTPSRSASKLPGILAGLLAIAGLIALLYVIIRYWPGLNTQISQSSTDQPAFTDEAPLPVSAQISPIDGMVMRYIPAGTFQMGDDAERGLQACQLLREPFTKDTCQQDWFEIEEPPHSVTLDAFWMDQSEVTNHMYAMCEAAGKCSPPQMAISPSSASYYEDELNADSPVISVDWEQAQAYCQWAGGALPTEAQWEYAARGGIASALYPWGNTLDGSRANFCDINCTSAAANPGFNDGYSDIAPAGSYPPNGYGLYDMAGNVEEWVADWYGAYPSSAGENPTGSAEGTYRVVRGGSWLTYGNDLRLVHRGGFEPNYSALVLGFRCARPLDTPGTAMPPSAQDLPAHTPTPQPYPTEISSRDGMVMRYIPAGSFQMGSEIGQSDEKPVHTVTLDAFWMDQVEITNRMYRLCDAAGACSSPVPTGSDTRTNYYWNDSYANYPVILVNWEQAADYCAWAGRQLPTEAQWEYAARGGLAGAAYPWGDEDPICSLFATNGAQYGACPVKDTLRVGSYVPNGYGLYDMAGNVREWVRDWFGLYEDEALVNPINRTATQIRILRGGSWVNDSPSSLRVSDRSAIDQDDYRGYDAGFRCVDTVDQPIPTHTPTPTGAVEPSFLPTITLVKPVTYTQQPGEFVYCIARRFDVDPFDLLELNELSENTVVVTGTTLKIPQSGSWPGDRTLINHPAMYTVRTGDTIFSIACAFGDVYPEAIIYYNGLTAPYTLTIGQQLYIP